MARLQNKIGRETLRRAVVSFKLLLHIYSLYTGVLGGTKTERIRNNVVLISSLHSARRPYSALHRTT